MGVPDGKRYSPLDPDEVHRDLVDDPVGTRRAVAAQPGVARVHQGCAECAALDPRRAGASSRRAVVALTMTDIAGAVPLPPDARPVRMWVRDDPPVLYLVVESAELDDVPLDQATPVLLLDECG